MLLASGGITGSQWDDVMFHLARWLVRHLDDPRLVIWIAERGGQLHDRWPWLIEHELDRFASLERDGKTSELNEIRLHAPKCHSWPTDAHLVAPAAQWPGEIAMARSRFVSLERST
jgi:hypothetical protein